MEKQQKMIGGISIERWKKAFAKAAVIAIEQDYFSDTLFYNLYPNTAEEAAAVEEENEELLCEVYSSKWAFAYEAFKEIFGVDRYSV